MLNNKLVLAVSFSIVLDVLCLIGLILGFNAFDNGMTELVYSLVAVSNFIFRSVFFLIIYKYHSYQRPYLIISLSSIVSLFIYMIYTITIGSIGQSLFGLSDLTIVMVIVNLAAAFYVSIDDSVFKWVKIPFMLHAVYLFLFKTPFVIYTEFMVFKIFGYLAYAEYNLDIVLVGIQYFFYIILSILFVRMVRDIDYM